MATNYLPLEATMINTFANPATTGVSISAVQIEAIGAFTKGTGAHAAQHLASLLPNAEHSR